MNYYKIGLLRQVSLHLKNGGIIAYPTEFCYGLGCNPFDNQAVKHLINLKARNNNKGLIVIADNILRLKRLISPLSRGDYSKIIHYWPGQNTLLMQKNAKLMSPNLTGKHNKIAVRVTKHELVRQLCSFLAMPLVSTSANRSGCRPVKTYRDCKRQFGKSVMVLPGRTSNAKRPSTIMDWATNTILR